MQLNAIGKDAKTITTVSASLIRYFSPGYNYARKKDAWVGSKMELFDSLSITDKTTEQALQSLPKIMQEYLSDVAMLKVLPDVVTEQFSRYFFWLGLLFAPFLPLIWISVDLKQLYFVHMFAPSWLESVLNVVLAYIVIIAPVYLVSGPLWGLIPSISTKRRLLFYTFSLPGILLAIYFLDAVISDRYWVVEGIRQSLTFFGFSNVSSTSYSVMVVRYTVIGVVIQAILLLVNDILSRGVGKLLYILLFIPLRSSHPVGFIVYNLLQMFDTKTGYPKLDWEKFEDREKLLSRLEKAAFITSYYLPRCVRLGDVCTDEWFKGRTLQIATALRDKKKWILTPQEDTSDYFFNSIAKTLHYMLVGKWEALEVKEPEKLTIPQQRDSATRFLFKAITVIIEAALPLVLLFGLQHFYPMFFQGGILTTIISIIVFYELSVFGSLLDPEFNTRVTDAQTIASKIFPAK